MFNRTEPEKPYSEGVSTEVAQAQIYSGTVGEIRRKMDNAYYASKVTVKNPALWFYYYGDPSENQFIKDFTYLLTKCQELEQRNKHLEYVLEASGVDPDK